MIETNQHDVCHGDNGAFLAPACSQAMLETSHVRALGADVRPRALHHDRAQLAIAIVNARMEAFPATLSVARGTPALGGQMVGHGELAHVETHSRKHLMAALSLRFAGRSDR